MFAAIACLKQHDLSLVAWSVLVCVISVASAFGAYRRAILTRGPVRLAWICALAMLLGSGVWATHFLAMLAYHREMRMGFGLGLTGLSWLCAIAGMGFGAAVAARSRRAGGPVLGRPDLRRRRRPDAFHRRGRHAPSGRYPVEPRSGRTGRRARTRRFGRRFRDSGQAGSSGPLGRGGGAPVVGDPRPALHGHGRRHLDPGRPGRRYRAPGPSRTGLGRAGADQSDRHGRRRLGGDGQDRRPVDRRKASRSLELHPIASGPVRRR